MTSTLESRAISFLKEEFHSDLEYVLTQQAHFQQHPLRGGVDIALFSFDLDGDKFFVFAGDTIPMIYPAMDLTPDELWAVHIGTEYFIEQGVTEDTDRKSPVFLTYLKMVSTVFQ